MTRLWFFPLTAGLLLAGCATLPTGPNVMVLPGNGKDFEQFKADDAVCRQWASQQTGTTTQQASTDAAVTGAAVGTVLGAAGGAAVGAAAGSPATGAAVGSGVGLLSGAAVGADQAAGAESPHHLSTGSPRRASGCMATPFRRTRMAAELSY